MPSHVRIFFWTVFAVQTYLIISGVWRLESYPTHNVNNLPISVFVFLAAILVFGWLIPSILAWLAAFRRQNWARCAFAALVVCGLILQFILVITESIRHYPPSALYGLREAAIDALLVAAIISSFTGNARNWFKEPSAIPQA
jgi:hypothetical protein